MFTLKASCFPMKKQSKYQIYGSGHLSMGCHSVTLCSLLWGKKKKRLHLSSAPPGLLSDWQALRHLHCLAVLENFTWLFAAALLCDWFLWRNEGIKNKLEFILAAHWTTLNYSYTSPDRVVSACVYAWSVQTCWSAQGQWWPPWEPPGTEVPPGGGRGRTAEAWPTPSAATRLRRTAPRLRADNQCYISHSVTYTHVTLVSRISIPVVTAFRLQ